MATATRPLDSKRMHAQAPWVRQVEIVSVAPTPIATVPRTPMRAGRRRMERTSPQTTALNGSTLTPTDMATILLEPMGTNAQRSLEPRRPTGAAVRTPTATDTPTRTAGGPLTMALTPIPTTPTAGVTTMATVMTTASMMIVQRCTAPLCTTERVVPTKTEMDILTQTAGGPPPTEQTPS